MSNRLCHKDQQFLKPEGHPNPISNSKITAILLKGLILPICGIALGRMCACSLRSRLVYSHLDLLLTLNNLKPTFNIRQTLHNPRLVNGHLLTSTELGGVMQKQRSTLWCSTISSKVILASYGKVEFTVFIYRPQNTYKRVKTTHQFTYHPFTTTSPSLPLFIYLFKFFAWWIQWIVGQARPKSVSMVIGVKWCTKFSYC